MSSAGSPLQGGLPKSSAAGIATGAVGGCGCLALPVGIVLTSLIIMVLGGLTVTLFPIVIVVLLFTGQSINGPNPEAGLTPAQQKCEQDERIRNDASPNEQGNRARDIFQSDGHGQLELGTPVGGATEACTVPNDLLGAIVDAGDVCDAIGPITIAAQIEYESRFNKDFVGPNGAEGISQVPKDKYKEFGGKDPFNAKDSIKVQARYLCSLAGQVKDLIDKNEATGDLLDLTLTAYDVGIDAVRAAHGVPDTKDSQSYIVGVRSWFAPMEGVGPPPDKIPAQSGLTDS
ncbi:transglycosylase SLT domain-containing protein [Streptomyces sp. NPDC088847]|uniref:transglycosylase SLT domain-containing protein n=1 Tax=Streptomyces sp. NPDC088847 TaxID=3365909 RepID=UPI0037F985A1